MMKNFLVMLLACAAPYGVHAQDDMYFIPKKTEKTKIAVERQSDYGVEHNYRDVDEYNRRPSYGSSYYELGSDSTANDIISFEPSAYRDSLESYGAEGGGDDDYTYSRRMNRFDDFYWYDPWYSSWSYGPYWYGRPYWAGYYGWYDPWYGWYRPWGYGWGHYYYRPVVSYYRPYYGITGTSNHGRVTYGRHGGSSNFSGYRGNRPSSGNARNGRFSGSRNRTTNSLNRDNNRFNNGNNRFNGNRRNDYDGFEMQSRPSFNTNRGSFGGNRGGSFSGGSRGGGSFGGSRGGGSFGGRR